MFVHIVIDDALYGGLWLHTVSCHICWHHITSHFLLCIQLSAVTNWLPTIAFGKFDSKKAVHS